MCYKSAIMAAILITVPIATSTESKNLFSMSNSFNVSLKHLGDARVLEGRVDQDRNELDLSVPFVSDNGFYSTSVFASINLRQKPQSLDSETIQV